MKFILSNVHAWYEGSDDGLSDKYKEKFNTSIEEIEKYGVLGKYHVINVDTIEELLDISRLSGEDIIINCEEKYGMPSITIHDDWL